MKGALGSLCPELLIFGQSHSCYCLQFYMNLYKYSVTLFFTHFVGIFITHPHINIPTPGYNQKNIFYDGTFAVSLITYSENPVKKINRCIGTSYNTRIHYWIITPRLDNRMQVCVALYYVIIIRV